MQKLKRRPMWLEDQRKSAMALEASQLTMDAFEATGSKDKAMFLGRIWQQISNAEIKYDAFDFGITEQGEEIRAMAWELIEKKFLSTTPQFGFDTPIEEDADEDGEEYEFDYDSDLLDEALGIMRKAILDAIYEEMPDASH